MGETEKGGERKREKKRKRRDNYGLHTFPDPNNWANPGEFPPVEPD